MKDRKSVVGMRRPGSKMKSEKEEGVCTPGRPLGQRATPTLSVRGRPERLAIRSVTKPMLCTLVTGRMTGRTRALRPPEHYPALPGRKTPRWTHREWDATRVFRTTLTKTDCQSVLVFLWARSLCRAIRKPEKTCRHAPTGERDEDTSGQDLVGMWRARVAVDLLIPQTDGEAYSVGA